MNCKKNKIEVESARLCGGGESTEMVLDDSALMTHDNLSPTSGFNEIEVDSGSI